MPDRRRAALADQQVHDEVLDGPLAAQGRLVLADLEGGVAQRGALGLGQRRLVVMLPTLGWGP